MNERKEESPAYHWLLLFFAIVVAFINGILSFEYSSYFLASAFGGVEADGANLLAGSYGVLIFDVAFVVWLWANMRLADTKSQRQLTSVMYGISLFGSTMATLTQLAINGRLIELSAQGAVNLGYISLGVMLVVTTGHIMALVAYFKLSPGEKVISKLADIGGKIQKQVLKDLESELEQDIPWLVEQMKSVQRNQILSNMGFDREGNMIADGQGYHGNGSRIPGSKGKGRFEWWAEINGDRQLIKRSDNISHFVIPANYEYNAWIVDKKNNKVLQKHEPSAYHAPDLAPPSAINGRTNRPT